MPKTAADLRKRLSTSSSVSRRFSLVCGPSVAPARRRAGPQACAEHSAIGTTSSRPLVPPANYPGHTVWPHTGGGISGRRLANRPDEIERGSYQPLPPTRLALATVPKFEPATPWRVSGPCPHDVKIRGNEDSIGIAGSHTACCTPVYRFGWEHPRLFVESRWRPVESPGDECDILRSIRRQSTSQTGSRAA